MPFHEIWGVKFEDYGAGVLLLPHVMMDALTTTNNNNSTKKLLTRAIQQARKPNVQKKRRNWEKRHVRPLKPMAYGLRPKWSRITFDDLWKRSIKRKAVVGFLVQTASSDVYILISGATDTPCSITIIVSQCTGWNLKGQAF